jgi:hypothetical protein
MREDPTAKGGTFESSRARQAFRGEGVPGAGDLDARMARSGLFYVRFIDDILVLAPTHARLRAAVRAVNESLSALRLEKHSDKTFIGKIQRGFDFLGYRIGTAVLKLADATVEKFVEQATLLYEQGRRQQSKAPLLGAYVRRGLGGATGGLDDLPRRGNGRVRAVLTLSTVAGAQHRPSSANH